MADEAKAMATMIANIEKQAGRTLAQLGEAVAASGLEKHGEIRTMLMETFGLGHGQANTVVHLVRRGGEGGAAPGPDEVLGALYSGRKADLRPIHDAVLAFLATLGPFEAAAKKDYVSYRRRKQFLMVGPKTNTAVELGLGAKSLPGHARLKEMPPNGMCRYTVRLASASELDEAVKDWITRSYSEAG